MVISHFVRNITIALFFLAVSHFTLVNSAIAQEQFSSSYVVAYDVFSSGVTEVTETITLKNLTDKYYASSLDLSLGITQISDISASDNLGSLSTKIDRGEKQTKINIAFGQQVIGLGKEYTFSIKFKSKDFSQAQGKTWQVTLPRLSSIKAGDIYNLTLSVPVSFGDPSSITPNPIFQSEQGGKIIFKFSKDQLLETGVLANFGREQLFDFDLEYNFENPNFLPNLGKIPIPANNDFQEVLISEIFPKPENVSEDSDGNLIAWFKVPAKSRFKIKVKGIVKLILEKNSKSPTLSSDEVAIFTSAQKYWEIENPAIKNKLDEIFKDLNPKTNQEKARLINNYVVNFLTYDNSRLSENNFERLGSTAALNNSTKALCGEFTDLFITLARAAGIPSRQIVGYAYTENKSLRPLSLKDEILHTWPQYYDEKLGWVMIDPTWQNTTQGVDYFSKFDLNHFALSTRGYSSESPVAADLVKVEFSKSEFKRVKNVNMSLDSPQTIFAFFPAKAKIRVENLSNHTIDEEDLQIISSKIDILGEDSFKIPKLAPFANFEYEFDLKTIKLWESYEDVIQVKAYNQEIAKKIIVKPFFAYKYFSFAIIGLVLVMVFSYFGILAYHLKFRPLQNKK